MKRFYSILMILTLSLLFIVQGSLDAQDEVSGGILGSNVNSDDEDYGAYLILGEETDTLFFTSSRPTENRRKIAITAEMFFSTRSSSYRNNRSINDGWNKAKQIVANDSKIAEFTRGAIAFTHDRNKMVFAAERDLTNAKARGTSYLFDLYEMYNTQSGFTQPSPMTAVNEPDYWDSQPSLSHDGKLLFFVSNRPGGEGGLDIWYSVFQFSKWSKPQPVPNINSSGNEFSPHFGPDGYFYFSSDWNFKENTKGTTGKDIYRASYGKIRGLSLPVNPIELDEAITQDASKYGTKVPDDLKYNSDKDDEFPYISPDRKSIFITSNRDAKYDKRNIYAFSLPQSRIRLQVNVSEKVLDAEGNVIHEIIDKKDLALTLVDKETRTNKDIMSGKPYEVDADKTYQIQFSKFVEEECYTNKIEGPRGLEIKTFRPFGQDTLFIENVKIVRQKVEIPPIVFHSTDTLPYFITGYWYPNTSENMKIFREREAQGFFNNTGFVDSTGPDYSNMTDMIDRSFINQLYTPLDDILPAFQDFCRDTLYLKVTIHGYTDPRGLSGGEDHPYRPQSKHKRNYPDETITVGIDERGQSVQIPSGINMLNYNWPIDPEDKDGRWIKLPNEGEQGNVLLSKLRAYFTFITFDRDMRKRSEIYEQMRNNGRVLLDAEGFGIDKIGYKERNLRDDPQSRRIEIYLDILRPEELSSHKRLAGGKLKHQRKVLSSDTEETKELPKISTENIDEASLVVVEEEPQEQQEAVQLETEKPDEVIIPVEDPVIKEELKSMEKEEEYSDEDEIAEKYEDIEEEQTELELLPPAEDIIVDMEGEEERSCYKIYYKAFDDSKEALKSQKVLAAAGVSEVRVVEMLDNFGGNRTFELYSGCYANAQDALKAMKNLSWTIELLKLERKPVIIR